MRNSREKKNLSKFHFEWRLNFLSQFVENISVIKICKAYVCNSIKKSMR